MRSPRSRGIVFRTVVGVLLLCLAILTWYGTRLLKDTLYSASWRELETHNRVLSSTVREFLLSPEPATLQGRIRSMYGGSDVRVTVMSPRGEVLADSHADPLEMDNHGARPEVIMAERTGQGHSIRYSHTLRKEIMYAVRALKEGDRLLGFIRTSTGEQEINREARKSWQRLMGAAALLFLFVATGTLYFARRRARTLFAIREMAAGMAGGDFSRRVPVSNDMELNCLVATINHMADQLDEKVHTITGQRNEQETLLSSMSDGILAVDKNERVIGINQALGNWLGVVPDAVRGKLLQDVSRNPELYRLVKLTLASKEPVEGDLLLEAGHEMQLQVKGSSLKDAAGTRGALMVLRDVTNLRHLEDIRREFVANVSHELKTPITSIKGYAETLRDSALAHPEDARRFVEIILKQSNRLQAIIEDLLALSRLEKDEEQGRLARQRCSLCTVIEGAVQHCAETARRREMSLDIECPAAWEAELNPDLFEQAVYNLLDNALKYSGTRSRIAIQVTRDETAYHVAVKDQGPGIAAHHLGRLFERFYRVDKARSKEAGGTGLGLAIVKHIMLAHHGSVDVSSKVGAGSTFTLHLPRS